MQKIFREKGKTEGMGKRENEIECREKGKCRAPNLKWQASNASQHLLQVDADAKAQQAQRITSQEKADAAQVGHEAKSVPRFVSS